MLLAADERLRFAVECFSNLLPAIAHRAVHSSDRSSRIILEKRVHIAAIEPFAHYFADRFGPDRISPEVDAGYTFAVANLATPLPPSASPSKIVK